MSETKKAVVSLETTTRPDADLLLCPDGNLWTGIKDFTESFPDPTSLERDVLLVASAVYACDLAFNRGERENITRSVVVEVPVVNLQAFRGLRSELETMLWVLSHDSWSFEFVRSKGSPEESRDWPSSDGKTLLFSGGLDSFAGAVDLLDEMGVGGLKLCSHVTANPLTRSSQNDLAAYLEGKYNGTLDRLVVRTGGHATAELPFPAYKEREETQRTRSFMFLAIAAIAARRSGRSEIVMIAENGQMAIHLPLSAGRIGAFSTHTAHPEFVSRVSDYFSTLLDFPVQVTNPFLYKTKGEVVRKLVSNFPDSVPLSVSCWRGSWLSKGNNHCGECIPCLIRRIALECNGLKLAEYDRDLLSEDVITLPADDKGKTDLVELAEFVHAFATLGDSELEYNYPDLINRKINRVEAVAMYRRFAAEAWEVFGRYPGVAKIMGTVPSATTTLPPKPSKPRPRKKSS